MTIFMMVDHRNKDGVYWWPWFTRGSERAGNTRWVTVCRSQSYNPALRSRRGQVPVANPAMMPLVLGHRASHSPVAATEPPILSRPPLLLHCGGRAACSLTKHVLTVRAPGKQAEVKVLHVSLLFFSPIKQLSSKIWESGGFPRRVCR